MLNILLSNMSSNRKLTQPLAAIVPRGIEPSQSLPGSSQRLLFVENQSSASSVPSEVSIKDSDEDLYLNEDSGLQHTRSENGLLSLVTRRLYDVESRLVSYQERVHELQQEIDLKEAKIQLLTQKLRNREKLLQGMKYTEIKGPKVTIDKQEYDELQERCATLRKTVEEMNQFFSDYGVTWVGESDYPCREEFVIDFQKLLNSIAELNLFVKEGEGHLVYTTQGATFKMPESVPLTLFSNGLALFSGPFRDYSDPATQEFVQDILDGFFPSELQKSYPDGVPFKVIDKHEVLFEDPKRRFQIFGGVGQQLGCNSSATCLRHKEQMPHFKTLLKQDINRGPTFDGDCQNMSRDNDANCFGDASSFGNNFKPLLENKGKKLQVKYSSLDSSSTSHLPGRQLFGSTVDRPLKLTKKQMRKKPDEDSLPVSVKRSSAPTSVPQEVSAEKHSKLVKKISLQKVFEEKIEIMDEKVKNNSTIRLLDKKSRLLSSNTSLTNMKKETLFQNNLLYGEATNNLGDCLENYRYSKPTVHTLSSCSTVPSGCLQNKNLLKEQKESVEKYPARCNKSGDKQFSCLPVAVRNQNNISMKFESACVQRRVGVDDFLKKLPSVVIRDGKLIDIRGGIAEKIQASKPSGPSYHTIKFDDNHPRIKLKIRSVDGEKLYIVHISPLQKLGDLRTGLDEVNKTSDGKPMKYTILNANIPSKSINLTNNHLTLKQLGISHNTVLYLQSVITMVDTQK